MTYFPRGRSVNVTGAPRQHTLRGLLVTAEVARTALLLIRTPTAAQTRLVDVSGAGVTRWTTPLSPGIVAVDAHADCCGLATGHWPVCDAFASPWRTVRVQLSRQPG